MISGSTNLLKKSLIYFGFWTLLGFSFAASNYFSAAPERRAVLWKTFLAWNLPEYYIWMLLSLVIIGFNKKYRLRKLTDVKVLFSHFILSLIFSLLHFSLLVAVSTFLRNPGADDFFAVLTRNFNRDLFFRFHQGIITYWIILFVVRAFEYQRQYKTEQLKNSQLETHLAEARLEALKMQLHPHFLFNTLHSISALTEENSLLARRMIARLGEFLRITLESSNVRETSLEKELDFLKRYLEIEQLRFHDRLKVEYDIESQTLPAMVPHLILQPIVENAIRHGISPRNSAGLIKISSRLSVNQTLILQIEDDGVGFRNKSSTSSQNGLGLKNTEARLEHYYEKNYQFSVDSNREKGVLVTLEIPFTVDGGYVFR